MGWSELVKGQEHRGRALRLEHKADLGFIL